MKKWTTTIVALGLLVIILWACLTHRIENERKSQRLYDSVVLLDIDADIEKTHGADRMILEHIRDLGLRLQRLEENVN